MERTLTGPSVAPHVRFGTQACRFEGCVDLDSVRLSSVPPPSHLSSHECTVAGFSDEPSATDGIWLRPPGWSLVMLPPAHLGKSVKYSQTQSCCHAAAIHHILLSLSVRAQRSLSLVSGREKWSESLHINQQNCSGKD